MTAKIDGTNGVLQAYDYQVPTTGFSYTFAAGTTVLVMNPAGTLATGTITMPASPADGMTITFSSTQTITALTVNANTGQSIVGAATVLPARQAGGYIYRLSNTTWYPYESVPTNVPATPAGGSIITSGTALSYTQATNSGTTLDFAGLPSWVKKITVIFQGVSLSATANILVQLGTGSTTYTTSGYLSTSNGAQAGGNSINTSTAGFVVIDTSAAAVVSGHMVITNITGNNWVSSHVAKRDTALVASGAGDVSLGAVLTAVRITSTSTDTFDAGTVNIFYE